MYFLFITIKKFRRMFSTKLAAFTFIMTEITIGLLFVICILIYGKEENLSGYLDGTKIYNVSTVEKISNIIFITCLCLTILGEFLCVVEEMVRSISNWLSKDKKYEELEYGALIWSKSVLELEKKSESKKIKFSRVAVDSTKTLSDEHGSKIETLHLNKPRKYKKKLKYKLNNSKNGMLKDTLKSNKQLKNSSKLQNQPKENVLSSGRYIKRKLVGTKRAQECLLERKKLVKDHNMSY